MQTRQNNCTISDEKQHSHLSSFLQVCQYVPTNKPLLLTPLFGKRLGYDRFVDKVNGVTKRRAIGLLLDMNILQWYGEELRVNQHFVDELEPSGVVGIKFRLVKLRRNHRRFNIWTVEIDDSVRQNKFEKMNKADFENYLSDAETKYVNSIRKVSKRKPTTRLQERKDKSQKIQNIVSDKYSSPLPQPRPSVPMISPPMQEPILFPQEDEPTLFPQEEKKSNSRVINQLPDVMLDDQAKYIEDCFKLDFGVRPRPKRCNSGGYIHVHEKNKRLTTDMKKNIVSCLNYHGYRMATTEVRKELAFAACAHACYDAGYNAPTGVHAVPCWFEEFVKTFSSGSVNPVATNYHNCGNGSKKPYIDEVEDQSPGYLLYLYRKACFNIGFDASFRRYAQEMNDIAVSEEKPLKLTVYHVWKFFQKYNGSVVSPRPKPRLTEKQKQERIEWAKKRKEEISEDDFYYCFLDEKWMYISGLRNKLKHIPLQPNEPEGTITLIRPKVRSRRHSCKVMYMGVIASPDLAPSQLQDTFDGKIFMKRVAKEKQYSRNNYSTVFCSNAEYNELLKNGGWNKLIHEFGDTVTFGDLKQKLAESGELDEFIMNRLTLVYHTRKWNKNGTEILKNKELKKIVANDEPILAGRYIIEDNGTSRQLTLGDLTLKVSIQAGDRRMEDCSCDSEFMLETMPEVAQAIRNKFSWVPSDKWIHLVLDNAGGHGTNDAIRQYKTMFESKKIKLIFQVPNSPETNMLDLGVWMTIQHQVGIEHYRKIMKPDALASSVEKAWENVEVKKLVNIKERWKKVLDLIVLGGGSNDLVETHRGKQEVSIPSGEEEEEEEEEFEDVLLDINAEVADI